MITEKSIASQVASKQKIKKVPEQRDLEADLSACNVDCVASGACFHHKKITRIKAREVVKNRLNPALESNPIKWILKQKRKNSNIVPVMGLFLFDHFIKGHEYTTSADENFGDAINLSRTSANRGRNKCVDEGIVYKLPQSADGRKEDSGETCTYELNPFFKTNAIRNLLRQLFPFIMITQVTLLAENPFKTDKKGCTQYKVSFLYTKKTLFNNSTYRSIKKKDGEMNINPVTEHLKSLKLTTTGRIKLSAFPTDVIELADRKLATALSKKAVADPFGYLMKVSIGQCRDRSLTPNYQAVNDLMRQHGCSEDDKRFDAILISDDEPAKTSKSHPRYSVKNREADLAEYYAEQEAWAQMDEHQRREYLRPFVNRQCKERNADWIQRFCPFMGSEELVASLVAEYKEHQSAISEQKREWESMPTTEQEDVWRPIIPQLKQLTQQQRAHYLTKSGCEYAIPIVEQLILSVVD